MFLEFTVLAGISSWNQKSVQKIDSIIEIVDKNLTNTPCAFHIEATWKQLFARRFNVEYMWCVCSENNMISLYICGVIVVYLYMVLWPTLWFKLNSLFSLVQLFAAIRKGRQKS